MRRTPHGLRPLVLISSLASGGAERVTVSFLRRLRCAGADIPLCTVSSHADDPLEAEVRLAGLTRHDLGARSLADGRALARLIALLRRGRYDVVHAHGQDAAVFAAIACGVLRLPLVITRHVLEEPRTGWRQSARASATIHALRGATALVAVSKATADSLARLTGRRRESIHVIPNGIELERFAPAGAHDATAARSALGVSPDDSLLVVPAMMRHGKGHEVLLDALAGIRAHLPRVRVAFAGTGPLEPLLRKRARDHGNAVLFLGHRHDMPALLHAADLVILPSHSEALPTALIEAAAAGRPVVSTRVGGVDEVVEHGRTGLLVPPADAEALAAATVSLLRDRRWAQALGGAATAVARERFDIDAQIRRTWRLWIEVAERAVAA